MVFRSSGLLEKHRALFCIGSRAGHLQVRRHSSELLTRDNPGCVVDPKQTQTPDLVQVSHTVHLLTKEGKVCAMWIR